jgi:5-methyltetrahydrofolate--homocysteine methyltransferase
MGVNIAQAVKELTEAGADVVGSNCGNGLEKMIEIAKEFRKATKLPIIIQSNAGLPEMNKGEVEYPEDPAFFGKKVKDLVQAGVSIIGGCCGTTPAHTAAIKKAIKQAN